MDEVFADRVPPMHVETSSLARCGWIELVKNVIDAVLIVAAVDVVHPAQSRAEVESRAMQ